MLPRTMRERSQGLVLALAVIGAIALVAGAAVGLASPAGDAPRPSAPAVPHVNHVFIIVLENENADSTFGKHTAAPYLARQLRGQGAFLPNYYAIGHESLDNYIAMVSGQAPNTQTQADCQVYTNFKPGTPTSNGQYRGSGCVYPAPVATVANQLEDSGHTWKGYMDGMNGKAPPGADIRCRHPALNSHDDTQTAEVGDQYAARHNPFVYFHSIIDSPTCAAHDVGYAHLSPDLRSEQTTPDYSFITPNLCHDGHDSPCVSGEPGGLATANTWLQQNVPADPSLARVRAPGASDRHLRRGGGRRRRRRLQRLLQRAAGAQPDSSRHSGGPDARARRRPGRRRPGLSVHQARNRGHDPLQPLLAAALDRAQLEPSLPGLRRTAGSPAARAQDAQPARLLAAAGGETTQVGRITCP